VYLTVVMSVGQSAMSNFYSPINGRSTYINTNNNIMAIREAKKTTTRHIHNLTKHYTPEK